MESDLISRSAAMEAINQHSYETAYDWEKTQDILNELPAVDAVPVVHGRWDEFENTIVCSACGEKWSIRDDGDFVIIEAKEDLRFCPSCGARMDAEGDK